MPARADIGPSRGVVRTAGTGIGRKSLKEWILLRRAAVEGPMTKKDKIAFIKSSKRKSHVYNDLHRYSDPQLDELIREIVQGLVRESELIANAYMNGYH